MPKKGEYVKLKNFERKIKSSFIIYTDFESILVPEDNRKQNRDLILQSLILANIKNILLAVEAINSYVLVKSLVSFLNHT